LPIARRGDHAAMPDWLHALYSSDGLRHLIVTGGPWVLVAIIFAETGLLAGFFLPGDSLLVTTGVLCAFNPLDPAKAAPLDYLTVAPALSLAAILGDWLNYSLGRLAGERAWSRPDGRLVKRRHLEEARDFYQRWGGFAIAGGRFVPIARTFVPFVAGVARMRFARFCAWNVPGSLVWIWSLTGLGYWIGNSWLAKHVELVILAVLAVSFVPLVIGLLRRWLAKRRARGAAPRPT
jgi:membrane-associated protein